MYSFIHTVLRGLKLPAICRNYNFQKILDVSVKTSMFPSCVNQTTDLWCIRKGILGEITDLVLLFPVPSAVGISCFQVNLVVGRRFKKLVDTVR